MLTDTYPYCAICGRRFWGFRSLPCICSERCRRKWRGDPRRPKGLRQKVRRRDNGICSRCGIDCKPITAKLEELQRSSRTVETALLQFYVGCGLDFQAWHADHIVRVADGGSHDLSNLRTLCVPCHHEVSTPGYLFRLFRYSAVSQSLPSEVAR